MIQSSGFNKYMMKVEADGEPRVLIPLLVSIPSAAAKTTVQYQPSFSPPSVVGTTAAR